MEQNRDPRERILQAAVQLLREGKGAAEITVRQVADLAGVGTGLINYHFQSKDNLLYEANGQVMALEANKWLQQGIEAEGLDALTRLKMLILQTSRLAFEHPNLTRIGLNQEVLQGRMETIGLILPMLREIYGAERDELSLRLTAFALIRSLQVAFLQMDALETYMGINLKNPDQRAALVDQMIDLVLNLPKE